MDHTEIKRLKLEAVFYARFHSEQGPTVIVQVPQEVVATRTNGSNWVSKKEHTAPDEQADSKAAINFPDISPFVIPPYDLCGKSLSVRVGDGIWVLGWPVSLESETYARNRFMFNICFVLRETFAGHEGAVNGIAEQMRSMNTWESVVKKVALFFQALELDNGILAADEDGSDGRGAVVGRVLNEVFEQLTTYGEACVRVDRIHTLNLRLSSTPTSAQSIPKANAWDVPLIVRSLPSSQEWTYDLVLACILPHLNGINHIARIAKLAEVDVKLVKRAVRALLALDRVKLLDIFHFQAVYALTQDFGWFVQDTEMREECRRYTATSSALDDNDITISPPPTTQLPSLYTSLSNSPSMHDFVLANQQNLSAIDIRRLVTFGVLKGFLRRKQKYLLAIAPSATPTQGSKISETGSGGRRSGEDAARDSDRAWKKAALSSGWATPPFQVGESLEVSPEKGVHEGEKSEISPEDEKLRGFLDGKHCLDEVCVGMRMGEKKVLDKLRNGKAVFGEVVMFCK